MRNALYVTSMQARSGKAVVALGLMELLTRQVERVAIFRPVIASGPTPDPLIELLRERYRLDIGLRGRLRVHLRRRRSHRDGRRHIAADRPDCSITSPACMTSSTSCCAWAPTTPGQRLPPNWLSTRSWQSISLRPWSTWCRATARTWSPFRSRAGVRRNCSIDHGCALVATFLNRVDADCRRAVGRGFGCRDRTTTRLPASRPACPRRH